MAILQSEYKYFSSPIKDIVLKNFIENNSKLNKALALLKYFFLGYNLFWSKPYMKGSNVVSQLSVYYERYPIKLNKKKEGE